MKIGFKKYRIKKRVTNQLSKSTFGMTHLTAKRKVKRRLKA